MAKSILF
jgi:ferredoxin